jgi:hypothetical protein
VFGVKSLGLRGQGAGLRGLGVRCGNRVWGLGCGVWGGVVRTDFEGIRGLGLGYSISGSRVQGSEISG